jgi:glycosyltransferase involved in cell wall biosynthesis
MKIRLGFIVDYPHYIGGINYLNNLLTALAGANDDSISPYVFVGTNVDDALKKLLAKNATVIVDDCFNRGGLRWYLSKLNYKLLGCLPQINRIMAKYSIDVVSHSDICAKNLPYKTINWLPDFQFLVMPQMFSWFERFRRHRLYRRSIKFSDLLLVSSNDANRHLKKYYKVSPDRAKVLQFVATLPQGLFTASGDQDQKELSALYGVGQKYFYCPNQFWKHKNHSTLLSAVKMLRDSGLNITVVMTGSEYDFRHPRYFGEIKSYAAQSDLQENLRFLGIIPYDHVAKLLRNSIAVINPSFFEGWSTTVEEVKSLGKKIVLSNLEVHREQAPDSAYFFSPRDTEALAKLLRELWNANEGGPDYDLEEKASQAFPLRSMAFGELFAAYIKTASTK